MSDTIAVDVADGKYTLHVNVGTGQITAERLDEPWQRNFVGDKLIFNMALELYAARQELLELKAKKIPKHEGPLKRFSLSCFAGENKTALIKVTVLCNTIDSERTKKCFDIVVHQDHGTMATKIDMRPGRDEKYLPEMTKLERDYLEDMARFYWYIKFNTHLANFYVWPRACEGE